MASVKSLVLKYLIWRHLRSCLATYAFWLIKASLSVQPYCVFTCLFDWDLIHSLPQPYTPLLESLSRGVVCFQVVRFILSRCVNGTFSKCLLPANIWVINFCFSINLLCLFCRVIPLLYIPAVWIRLDRCRKVRIPYLFIQYCLYPI